MKKKILTNHVLTTHKEHVTRSLIRKMYVDICILQQKSFYHHNFTFSRRGRKDPSDPKDQQALEGRKVDPEKLEDQGQPVFREQM